MSDKPICDFALPCMGFATQAATIARLEKEKQGLAEQRAELLKLIVDFVDAFDVNAVEIRSADIDLGDNNTPHPFHEEWLHRARTAINNARATGAAS